MVLTLILILTFPILIKCSDTENQARNLHESFEKGFYPGFMIFITELSFMGKFQIREIQESYLKILNVTLVDDLNRYLLDEKDVREFIGNLLLEPSYYDAKLLRNAIENNDKDVLIEVLISRNNEEKKRINKVYKKMYGKELKKHLREEYYGDFKRFLVSLSIGLRDESKHVDLKSTSSDAFILYYNGEAKPLATHQSIFNEMFVCRSFEHLRQVFEDYPKHSNGLSIEQSLNNEFDFDILNGLLQLVQIVRDKSKYFAEKLDESAESFTRVMISRANIDLKEIIEEYGGIEKLKKMVRENYAGLFGQVLEMFAVMKQLKKY